MNTYTANPGPLTDVTLTIGPVHLWCTDNARYVWRDDTGRELAWVDTAHIPSDREALTLAYSLLQVLDPTEPDWVPVRTPLGWLMTPLLRRARAALHG